MSQHEMRKTELAIGFFILSGIVGVMAMILITGEGFSMFRDSYKTIVEIKHIGGLVKGAPVKLGGVQIGKVVDIRLKRKFIEVECDIYQDRKLTADCEAHIATEGLVGDTFMEFSQGEDEKYMVQETEPDKIARVAGVSQPSTAEILARIEGIGIEVTSLFENLNKIVGDEDVQNDIRSSVKNVNATTIEARKLVAKLSMSVDKIKQSAESVAGITESIERMADTVELAVNKTVGDPKQVAAINEFIANARAISAEIKDKKAAIGKSIENLKVISDKIAAVSKSIRTDQGVLKLLTDPEVEHGLKKAIEEVTFLAATVGKLGISDLLADNKMADRIVAKFAKENSRLNAEQMALEWKRFVTVQKIIGGKLLDPKYKGGMPPWKGKDFESWKANELKKHREFQKTDKKNR